MSEGPFLRAVAKAVADRINAQRYAHLVEDETERNGRLNLDLAVSGAANLRSFRVRGKAP